jgi:hypothetical protein
VWGALPFIGGHELHAAFARALTHVQGGKVVPVESKTRRQSVKEQCGVSPHLNIDCKSIFFDCQDGLENIESIRCKRGLSSRRPDFYAKGW